jgi:predicted metal-dependent HD superfamily phosphohydrolase
MGEPSEDDSLRILQQDGESWWSELFPDPSHRAIYWELANAYSAPGRHHHDLHHIRDCLRAAGMVSSVFDDHAAVRAAIWFHDAVYDPTRPDNEAKSADLAERSLKQMGQSAAFVVTVHDLILDTRHTAPPGSNDGGFLVDIDLAILGTAPEQFDTYDRNVRLEYAHVPDDAYRVGRARVLRGFLAREFIYHTQTFRDLYESTARQNLARALKNLHL